MKFCIKEKWNKMPLAAKISASYVVCSVLQRSLSFITMPIFTRLLTTEQYGESTVYASWASLLGVFLTLQLPYGSFSKAMIKFEDKRDEYISSAEGICLLLSLLFLAVYLPFSKYFNKLFELPTLLVVLMVLEILAGSGLAFWSGKKKFEYKYKGIIAVTLLMSVLTPVLQYIFVINSSEKGIARIIGGATVAIAIGGTIFFICMVKGKKIYNREYWSYALNFNIPLLAYYLSQMAFNSSDRIMISHLVGKDKAAIYGVAYTLGMMMSFVLSAIYNSYVPWFYEKLRDGKQAENRAVANAISVFMAILLLGIIWFAPEIIHILAAESYAEAVWTVLPVAMSTLLLFYAQLSISFEFYFEKKKMLVNASIGAAIVNILLNALFIPIYGYIVAGYTTLFSYLLFVAGNYLALLKIAKEQDIEDIGFDTKSLVIIYLTFSGVGVLGVLLYSKFVIRLLIAIIVLATILFERKRLLGFWRMMKGGKQEFNN